MGVLKKIPLFLFLLVLFFCLHGSVENYGFIESKEVAMLGLVITGCVLLLFLIVLIFTRNYLFAALTSFFISLWYLFFGALHDWVKAIPFLSFMNRYAVLLPLLIAATIVWIIYLRRHKAAHTRWTFYLNLLLLIYCCVDGFIIVKNYFTPAKKITAQVAFEYDKVKAKPNVYYLLFDEYPGYKSLKDSFAFANDSLYDLLHKKEFRMLPTFTNYDFTLFSMSSILNMRYVDSGYIPLKVSQRDFQLRANEIRNGEVFDIFEKMGYRFNNYSIFDIGEQHGVSNQNSFLPVHSLLLTDKILHNRIIRTSGWLFTTGKLALSSWRKKYLFQHDTNNGYSEKKVIEMASGKKTVPEFCYAHFSLPHWPFYRDSAGHYNSDEIIASEASLFNRALYLGYLKYTNTVIASLVQTITENDPNSIIVIMSDHGYRTFRNEKGYEPFNYNNICAVRFPDKNYIDLKEKWSTVNFFRYLFNCEYGQNIPYLADSSVVLSY